MSDDRDKVNVPPSQANSDPLVEALARLEPAAARLDRDRLMFAAGAASRRSTIRLWQAAAGFMAAVGFAAGMASKAPWLSVDRDPPPAKVAPANDKAPE
ncbi:MAG TPA: hypothetical protein VGI99_13415 [Gemmataceae bacterium]|jgi:hypothetical protein